MIKIICFFILNGKHAVHKGLHGRGFLGRRRLDGEDGFEEDQIFNSLLKRI